MIVAITGLVIFVTAVLLGHFPQIWTMLSWFRPSRTSSVEDSNSQGAKVSVDKPDTSANINGSVKKNGEVSPDATPKATVLDPSEPVPAFALTNGADDDEDEDEDSLPPPQFPALNSAQRASGSATTSTLMPPPARPMKSMAPPPLPQSTPMGNSLRIPTTGPLPSRTPAGLRTSSSLSLPSSAPPTRSRKVILGPGYSPLDWASLTRTHPNLAGTDPPGKLQLITPTMLKANNGRRGRPCWSSFRGKVYNLTPYVPFHPGGEGEIRRAAGKDGEKLFNEIHPWVNWDNMLGACVVGIMVSEGEGKGNSDMEMMD